MKKFLMICYVSADFGPHNGAVFHVGPEKIGVFIEAPEWIKETLMFRWLLKDGSIKIAEEQISMKQGENDPMKGISGEGKDEKVSEKNEEEIVNAIAEEPAKVPSEEPVKKTRTRKAKTGDAK